MDVPPTAYATVFKRYREVLKLWNAYNLDPENAEKRQACQDAMRLWLDVKHAYRTSHQATSASSHPNLRQVSPANPHQTPINTQNK